MPISGADRTRAYRDRKRALDLAKVAKEKIIAKTATQRNRDYRARKKLRLSAATDINHNEPVVTPPTICQAASTTTADKVINNPFGYECSICDRLFFKMDLQPMVREHKQIIWKAFPGIEMQNMVTCSSCYRFLSRHNTRTPSKSKSFVLWRYMLTKMLFFPKTFIN